MHSFVSGGRLNGLSGLNELNGLSRLNGLSGLNGLKGLSGLSGLNGLNVIQINTTRQFGICQLTFFHIWFNISKSTHSLA